MAQGWRRSGRTSVRETMKRNLAWFKAQSPSPEQRERYDDFIERAEAAIPPAPKARAVRRPVDGRPAVPSEREVLKACLQYLRVHPKVACVWRQNSGTFTEQNADGTQRYISAHTMPGLPDIVGFLKGGRALFCEVKAPGRKATPMQQAFIERANAAGALAAVVTSVDEIEELLR